MIRHIELNKEGIGRLVEHEPFLLPDKIQIEFTANQYDLQNAFISLRNGTQRGVFKLERIFEIPQEFLHAGYLNIRVEMFLDGVCVKRWDVLPIKLIEVPLGTEMRDYLGEIEEKLAKQQERIERLEKQNQIIY